MTLGDVDKIGERYRKYIDELNLNDTDNFTKLFATVLALKDHTEQQKDALSRCQAEVHDLRADIERHVQTSAILATENADLRQRLEGVRKENDTLRGLLGNSAKDCPYCGLPAAEQAKCALGFPGCERADDQMLSKHFAEAYEAECLRKELKEAERKLADAHDAARREVTSEVLQELDEMWEEYVELWGQSDGASWAARNIKAAILARLGQPVEGQS